MNISDLHDVRDGGLPRRRPYNPFVHLPIDAPLMRMLFAITRPGGRDAVASPKQRLVQGKVVRAAQRPGGSMVSYAQERRNFRKP